MKKIQPLLTAATALALGFAARADIISANFSISLNDANSVDADESAVAVPGGASHSGATWNNVLLRNTGSGAPTQFTAATQGGNSISLQDDLGNAAASLTSSGSFFSEFANVSSPNQASTGEGGLFQSFLNLNDTESVTVSGLSSAFTGTGYNVFVFFDIGTINRTYGLTLNAGGFNQTFWTQDTPTDSDPDNDGAVTWLRTTATTAGSAPADANYAVFEGLTSDTFSISGITNTGQRGIISGFQVVSAVPEPGSLGLAAFGIALLYGARRKRRG